MVASAAASSSLIASRRAFLGDLGRNRASAAFELRQEIERTVAKRLERSLFGHADKVA